MIIAAMVIYAVGSAMILCSCIDEQLLQCSYRSTVQGPKTSRLAAAGLMSAGAEAHQGHQHLGFHGISTINI